MKTKRQKLGQHFLRSQKYIGQIVNLTRDLLSQTQVNRLLEIGPGPGALTNSIVEMLDDQIKFAVVEKDDRLAKNWNEHPRLTCFHTDFLELDRKIWAKEPVVVVSNLPYSTGTRIFESLAEQKDKVRGMVLMFQQEVARRICAPPNTKERGSLSVWSQNHWDIEYQLTVPPGAFKPPPKVQSGVISLTPRTPPRVPGSDTHADLWQKLLRVSFAHRRKMLRSGLPKGYWKEVLERSQLDGTRRPQTLDWNDWTSLMQAAIELKSHE